MKIINKVQKYWYMYLGICLILVNFLKLKVVNIDYLIFGDRNFIDTVKFGWQYLLVNQSRPNILAPLFFAVEVCTPKLYFLYATLFTVCMAAAIYKLCEIIYENSRAALLGGALAVGFFTISLEPFALPTGYVFAYGISILCVLFSIYCCILFHKTGKRKNLIISIILINIACYIYEAAVVYLALLCLINLLFALSKKEHKFKILVVNSLGYILSGLVYIALFTFFKLTFVSNYDATSIENVNLSWVFSNIKDLLIANLPGFYFFNNPSQAYEGAVTHGVDYNYFDMFILSQVVIWIVVCWQCLKSKQERKSNFMRGYIGVILLGIVLPIVPSAMTNYTYHMKAAGWRLVVIGNHYSYCFMILGIVGIVMFLARKMYCRPVLYLELGALTLAFYFTAYTNWVNADTLSYMGQRYGQIEEVITDFSSDKNDLVIYAPSLFEQYGLMHVSDTYYTSHLSTLLGKSITVYKELPEEDLGDMYYLRYVYNENWSNSYYVIAESSWEELWAYQQTYALLKRGSVAANQLKIYEYTDKPQYMIEGILASGNNGFITISDGNTSSDYYCMPAFSTKVLSQRNRGGGYYNSHFINGGGIDANSITIQDVSYYVPSESAQINIHGNQCGSDINTCKIVKGLWYDDWAENEFVFDVVSNEQGMLEVSLSDIVLQDQLNVLRIYSKDTLLGEYEITEDTATISVSVPPNELLRLTIVADHFKYLSEEWERVAFPDAIYHRKLSYKICSLTCK